MNEERITLSKDEQGGQMTIMKLCTRVSQVLLLLVALCGISFLTTPPAHANALVQTAHAENTQQVNLPANCFLTVVQLNGTNPATAECMVPGKVVNGKMVSGATSGKVVNGRMIPHPSVTDCYSIWGWDIGLQSTTQGDVCLVGWGYTAFRMVNVWELDGGLQAGWVMYYKDGNPGVKFYYDSGTHYNGPVFDGTTLITQVCVRC